MNDNKRRIAVEVPDKKCWQGAWHPQYKCPLIESAGKQHYRCPHRKDAMYHMTIDGLKPTKACRDAEVKG